MKIAIDITPIENKNLTGHKVRGAGMYIKLLADHLEKYDRENRYTYFTKGEKIPKDADIVHYPYFEPFFLTLPLFKKHKTVVTVHDLIPLIFPKNFPTGIKGELKWQVQRLSLMNTSAIITDSNSSKKDIIDRVRLQENKVHVVYLAADENFKKIKNIKREEEIKKKYNLPDSFVLYVGDVTWNKNLPRLIESVQKANIPLVMVGKALISENYDRLNPWNKDLAIIQAMIKNDSRIKLLGFVSIEDLVLLYSLATVFVMPSLYEGFGLPIVEAMSCGCPVITSKEGSLEEIGGDAVKYVDAFDSASIMNGIKSISTNKILQKELSQKGLKQVKKFTISETLKKTISVYDRVFKG